MSIQEPPIALRNTLHQLAEEARQRAASVPAGTADHDFYVGVITAAEDRLHPARQDAHDEAWLARQGPSFRDGYLKASDLISAAAGHTPLHFPLPSR